MTRRDRYALALALECLRWHGHRRNAEGCIGCAQGALGYGERVAGVLLNAAYDAEREMWEDDRAHRLLRARLALLLRVLLRADGLDAWSGAPGGYDMEGCEVCHWRGEVPGREHDEDCRFCGGYGWTLAPIHITPLWDLAARGASR